MATNDEPHGALRARARYEALKAQGAIICVDDVRLVEWREDPADWWVSDGEVDVTSFRHEPDARLYQLFHRTWEPLLQVAEAAQWYKAMSSIGTGKQRAEAFDTLCAELMALEDTLEAQSGPQEGQEHVERA